MTPRTPLGMSSLELCLHLKEPGMTAEVSGSGGSPGCPDSDNMKRGGSVMAGLGCACEPGTGFTSGLEVVLA